VAGCGEGAVMTVSAFGSGEAARIRARLAGLAEERTALEAQLATLEDECPVMPDERVVGLAAQGCPSDSVRHRIRLNALATL